MRKHLLALSLATALPLLAAGEDIKLDSSTLGGLRARSIGPAVMGGRIAAMDGHATADAPVTVYAGAASGGIWKSTDGGTSFKPVFEEHIQSIGAMPLATFGGGSYRTGKLDATDLVRTARFNAACNCWVPADEFRPPTYR